MKTKSVIVLVVILCVSILTVVRASSDRPLKSKIPSWKYVIIIQAGNYIGEIPDGAGTIHKDWQIERNVVEVLRSDKNELPPFDIYTTPKNQIQGKYYLMYYFQSVEKGCGSCWGSYDLEKTNN